MEQEKIWDSIAGEWATCRVRSAEEIVKFLSGKKGMVLDLGCGSGRNCLNSEELKFYGVDFSEELLKFAEGKGYVELKKGYVYDIPYDDEFFDFVVFARVLHCVDSANKRRKSLEEVYRVLKRGGEAIISVWGRGKDSRIKNKDKECFIPWTVNGKKYNRFTYIYDVDELMSVLESVGFLVKRVEVGKNIVVIVKKK